MFVCIVYFEPELRSQYKVTVCDMSYFGTLRPHISYRRNERKAPMFGIYSQSDTNSTQILA
jgi:hypothetical protein